MISPNDHHPVEIQTTVASYEMGRQLARLRYDKLQEVLIGMEEEVGRQVQGDVEKGRHQLSSWLASVYVYVSGAAHSMANVVRICQTYIDKEKANG